MADAIMEGLEEYASLATDDLKASVRKAGKTVKDEIACNGSQGHWKIRKELGCENAKGNIQFSGACGPF